MNLFLESGHLSGEGLDALIAGTLDELQSLEAAEHLSFCDDCLLAYTQRLAEDTWQTPPASVQEGLWNKIRARMLRVMVNRYAVAAVAACLALTLWGTGFFNYFLPQRGMRHIDAPQNTMTVSARVGSFVSSGQQALQDALGNLFSNDSAKKSPPETVSVFTLKTAVRQGFFNERSSIYFARFYFMPFLLRAIFISRHSPRSFWRLP